MSRSRSSFDLSGAIATAASLSVVVVEEPKVVHFKGMPLVSFDPAAAPPFVGPTTEPELAAPPAVASAPAPSVAPIPPAPSPPPPAPPIDALPAEHAPAEDHGPADTVRRPPKLPDLSALKV